MIKLNRALLQEVKQGFVPQGGQQEPVAGAGPMTAGLSAGGMGADPNAGGGAPPMDPNAAGGMPPMDPSMQGMPPPSAAPVEDPNASAQAGSPPITLSIDDFIRILESVAKISGGSKGTKSSPATPAAGNAPDPRIDHIIGLLHSAMGGQAQ
jgi:hypothetical protein